MIKEFAWVIQVWLYYINILSFKYVVCCWFFSSPNPISPRDFFPAYEFTFCYADAKTFCMHEKYPPAVSISMSAALPTYVVVSRTDVYWFSERIVSSGLKRNWIISPVWTWMRLFNWLFLKLTVGCVGSA